MFLRQSTSQVIRFGPFVDSTDGVTPETGLTIAQADMQLSKDGAAFAQKSAAGNATHDTDGWYSTTLSTTDTATTGELKIQINVSGALPVWETYFVLTASAYDSLQTGTFNNISSAEVNTQCDTALTDYDGPTNAEMNARTLVAASYFDPATDTVANVTTVATTTTNTDMRGTDSANTVVPPSVAQFNARTRLDADYFSWATDTVANVTLVATTTTNTDMRGTDGANTTAPDNASITSILADTNELQTNQGNWLTATGFSTSAEIAALNDISVVDILTTQMSESYAADGVAPTLAQGIFNIQQNLGDFAYAGTTKTTKKIDGSTTAATYTLDDATNPTSSTRAT